MNASNETFSAVRMNVALREFLYACVNKYMRGEVIYVCRMIFRCGGGLILCVRMCTYDV